VAGCSDVATRAQRGGMCSGKEAREVATRSTGAEVKGMQSASEVVCVVDAVRDIKRYKF